MKMSKDSYYKYLLTPQWKQRRKQRIDIDKGICQMCGKNCSMAEVQIHHLSYDRVGHENVWTDLVTLCSGCHEKVTRMWKRKREPEKG